MGLVSSVIHSCDDDIAHLYQVRVGPQARGHGVGRQLLRSLIEWSQSIGVGKLQLGVTIGNSAAVSFYTNHWGLHPPV